ncbi:hypothetical protein PybrP1_006719 [[Pythium] brassicae (nom. inval.)]|nr:hypothetical protein PybrP1_006719 [[Pythium] brassicae (nom. inval.)]
MGAADRKRKQPPPASTATLATTTTAAPTNGSSSRDDGAHHAKFYAIAAITSPPRRAPAPPSGDLLLLPRTVMELVFSFAVKDLALKLAPAKCRGWRRVNREKVAIERLACWRGVCVYWRELIDDIVAQYRQRRLKLNLSYKSGEQVLACAEQIAHRGERLVDLRVALYGYYDVQQGLDAASRIPWHDFLRQCPNLERLDLSEMAFLTRAHMGTILDAAAEHCLKLQALVLPLPLAWDKYARFYSRAADSDAKFALDDEVFQLALEHALARWCTRGRHVGLRQLTVAHSLWTSTEFVAAVTKYCPNIEVLDGWKLTYLCDGWAPVTCDEEWKVTDAAWAAFCRTCVRLREFNWAVVPFTDAFFRPFGATPKVLLTDLLMDFADSFGAEEALDDPPVDHIALTGMAAPRIFPPSAATAAAAALAQSEYVEIAKSYSSEGLCALVRGLPFLTRLKVYLHPSARIDVDVFDDQFFAQLAASTPYLEQLSIVEPGQYDGEEAIRTVSERGLSALAGIAALSDVALSALEEATADGLLAFVRQRSLCARQRNVKIGVMKGVGMCIIDILKALTKAEPGAFAAGRPFALVVENQGLHRGRPADPKSAKRVEDKIHSLRALLERRHPSVRCQLTLAREKSPRQEGLPYRIAKFALFSTNWSFPAALGGAFYRGDLAYDPSDTQRPFEMIVKLG